VTITGRGATIAAAPFHFLGAPALTVELLFAGLFLQASLLAAAVFVHLFVRRPPTAARFKMLCNCATASVLLSSSGTVTLADALLPALSARVIDGAVIVLMGLMTAAAAFLAWVNFRVPARPRAVRANADYYEDADGNPVRATNGTS